MDILFVNLSKAVVTKLHKVNFLIPLTWSKGWVGIEIRGATEQSTLAERGKFYENSIPILRVDYSCAYNNLLKRLRF